MHNPSLRGGWNAFIIQIWTDWCKEPRSLRMGQDLQQAESQTFCCHITVLVMKFMMVLMALMVINSSADGSNSNVNQCTNESNQSNPSVDECNLMLQRIYINLDAEKCCRTSLQKQMGENAR